MSRPLTRDNNKDFEHILPTKEELKKKGINGWVSGWHFNTQDKILAGKSAGERATLADSTIIKGLRCPDCHSCAHKTDVPGVATCCSPIGWYFFYRRLDQDVRSSQKLVIKNGELVLDESTEKQEGSF